MTGYDNPKQYIEYYENSLNDLEKILAAGGVPLPEPDKSTSAAEDVFDQIGIGFDELPDNENPVAQAVARSLLLRDIIDLMLASNDTRLPVNNPTLMETLDRKLYRYGKKAIYEYEINLPVWRSIYHRQYDDRMEFASERGQNTEHIPPGWWWYMDVSNDIPVTASLFRRTFWTVLAGLIFLIFASFILDVTTRVMSFVINLFNQGAGFESGFELISTLGLAAQFIVIGQLVIRFTRRFADGINIALGRFMRSLDRLFSRLVHTHFFSHIARSLLPITRIFMMVVLFSASFVLINSLVLPGLQTIQQQQIDISFSSGELDSIVNSISSAQTLNPAETYSIELMVLGLQHEDAGRLDDARAVYEQVLGIDTNLLFARYRLAELYIESGIPLNAAPILDVGLNQLEAAIDETLSNTEDKEGSQTGNNNPPPPPNNDGGNNNDNPPLPGSGIDVALTSDALANLKLDTLDSALKMQFLLLVSRARAFLDAGYPSEARKDLDEADRLAKRFEALFILPSDIFPGNDLSGQLSTISMFYYRALVNEARYAESGADGFRTRAADNWRAVITLASDRRSQDRLWSREADDRLDALEAP